MGLGVPFRQQCQQICQLVTASSAPWHLQNRSSAPLLLGLLNGQQGVGERHWIISSDLMSCHDRRGIANHEWRGTVFWVSKIQLGACRWKPLGDT